MASGFTGAATDFGAAASDLISAGGEQSSAAADTAAASLEEQNVQLERESVAVQSAQQQRQLYKSLSSTQAQAGGAGLSSGGSIGNVLRASAAQGALAKNIIGIQGTIQENAYQTQATAYEGEAAAASAAATAKQGAGAFEILGGVASIFGL